MTNQHRQKEIMADKYEFPYHYLPSLAADHWQLHRQLNWGFEYIGYLSEVIDMVESNSQGRSILDIGCGDGRLVNELATRGFGPITGIDIDERAIAFANAFKSDAPGNDVTFQCGDSNSLMKSDYQVITLMEVIEHMNDGAIASFVASIKNRIASDGTLIVSVPMLNVPVTKAHFRHYDLKLLQSHLQPHFKIESHMYIHADSFFSRLIQRLVSNRLFIVNSRLVLRLLTRLYKRYCLQATSTTGAHLIAVASVVGSSAQED
jgi:2-polyprenyl-3-methyl-5-hydroxy-6-metoxy-1,4-benzoquinol methylase